MMGQAWCPVVTEMQNHGVQAAIIVCRGRLKDLPDAVASTRPQASIQLCAVHLERNALRYASKQH